jgi:hypothetical protein
MVPSSPPEDRLAQTLQREVVRRKRLTAALVLASCAVTVVSAVTFRERQALQRATAELAACERACLDAAPDPGGAGFHVPARVLAEPRAIPDILAVPLEVACDGGDVRDATLDLAAAPGVVHLVNLWQLSCKGCIRELPLLARALDRAGGAARFLPVDDPGIRPPASDYAIARARHGMPAPTLALIDRGLDGARLLPAFGPLLAGTPSVYPLSFVLDCERKLRWWKVGALDDAEADALADLLVRLGSEAVCRPDVPQPDVCRDPARARVVRRDRVKRERPLETPPLAPPEPPLPDAVPVEPDPPEPAPEPVEPPPQPTPAPRPEPPRLYPSREACQAECRAERHTCQIAPRGAYQCAPPPDTQ